VKGAALALVLSCALSATAALADGAPAPVSITADTVVVRFHAPETGGASRPRYVTARTLAFEARLVALENATAAGVSLGDVQGAYDERDVRTALDQIIAEEMLAKLPLDKEPDVATQNRVVDTLREALWQRIGGVAYFEKAALREGIAPTEVDAMLRRRARAAIYIDRAVGNILGPTEEQLHEVYRTTAHPFRAKRFDDCHDELSRWLVAERFRAAETAFLEGARTRVTVVYVGRPGVRAVER
jgi:hypothetical protein